MHQPLYDIKDYNKADLIAKASDFFADYRESLWHIMKVQEDTTWTPMTVDFLKMLNKDQLLGNLLLSYPKKMSTVFQRALIEAQEKIISNSPSEPPITCKRRIVLRWSHLPVNPEVAKGIVPRSSDVNRMVSLRGTVVRVNSAKMIQWELAYMCQHCGGTFTESADIESFVIQQKPARCKAKKLQNCNSKAFVPISTASSVNCRDYQEIKIQEQVDQLGLGALPKSIVCILMDELAGMCNAGDDVTVNGIVVHRWGHLQLGERPEIELVLIANHVSINNEQKGGINVTEELKSEFEEFWKRNQSVPLKARNEIIKSICPEVYGMHAVKLVVALVLAGGVRIVTQNSVIRGESHLLMIGDPGTGKSQILKFAAKLSNRSVMTTGIGTTGAGLTVTAVKEAGGEWILEAGALVLADGGVCCIDEFASIQPEDQTAIHEAMEQQTLHVAKAGLVCSLNTRCSVLAATNPRGKYNTDESISVNVALGAPLLSRFDLVLVMLDKMDEEWDKMVSSFILQGRTECNVSNSSQPEKSTEKDEYLTQVEFHQIASHQTVWPIEKLQAYLSWVRASFKPEVSAECQTILKAYYHKQRQSDGKDSARTTIRLLESLIRLAQGHAKIMAHHVCTRQDGLVAVLVMESSMMSASLGNQVPNVVRSFFHDDPDKEYAEMEAKLLRNLGLDYLILPSSDTIATDMPRIPPENSGWSATQGLQEDAADVLLDQQRFSANATQLTEDESYSAFSQHSAWSQQHHRNKLKETEQSGWPIQTAVSNFTPNRQKTSNMTPADHQLFGVGMWNDTHSQSFCNNTRILHSTQNVGNEEVLKRKRVS